MLKSKVERLESACNGSKEESKGYYEQRISAVEKTNEKITTILEFLVKSIKQNGPDPEKTLGLAFSDKVDVNRDYQNNQNSMDTSDGEQDSSVIVLPEEERRDKLITKINPEVDRCKLKGNQSTKVSQLEKKLYSVPARQNVVPQEGVPLVYRDQHAPVNGANQSFCSKQCLLKFHRGTGCTSRCGSHRTE